MCGTLAQRLNRSHEIRYRRVTSAQNHAASQGNAPTRRMVITLNATALYRKRHAVTLSEAKGLGIHSARRDASLRSA